MRAYPRFYDPDGSGLAASRTLNERRLDIARWAADAADVLAVLAAALATGREFTLDAEGFEVIGGPALLARADLILPEEAE